ITSHIQEIGASDHKLAMRDLKPLSGLGRQERADFWPSWTAIMPRRRAEIARSMVELAEDDIELDFSEAQIWLLDDDDSEVRASRSKCAGARWKAPATLRASTRFSARSSWPMPAMSS